MQSNQQLQWFAAQRRFHLLCGIHHVQGELGKRVCMVLFAIQTGDDKIWARCEVKARKEESEWTDLTRLS